MKTLFINIIFLLFTVFIFIRIISYALYEIKEENNSFGGISLIVLTFFSIIFADIMVWIS